MTELSHSTADHDTSALAQRVLRRREQYARSTRRAHPVQHSIAGYVRQLITAQRALPVRYVLHLLVVVLVPLAILISQAPLGSPAVVPSAVTFPYSNGSSDLVAPVAPITLQPDTIGDAPVPDSAFEIIDALPMPGLNPQLLRPQPIAATIVADSANVRGGPGTNYDKVDALPAGTPLQVLAQIDGWYQARTNHNRIIWIAAELLNLDSAVADFLPVATNIPTPPPAKIGLATAEGLNLRDGPGTSYIGMTKLKSGSQLDLLARYGDWFQVQTPAGQAGWVLGQYLAISPGVVDRVEVVTSIPEANPALIGRTSERNVNLRGGPGTAYEKIGALGTGTQLDLLGRYEDWFKVRTLQGSTGWISNELLDVSTFISRRVPVVRSIPALARRTQVGQAAAPRHDLPAPAAAAGNVVGYAAQFVGASYVWGGIGPNAFDCSGFTRYVYKQFGLDLPHSSAGQYNTAYGTMISNPADLRPGDIVFFVNTYKRGISHVGIYVGGGDVVQAISPKFGVGVASLNGGYWAQHYYGGIRPAR
ncbi:MAG: SH3 domain-containing protein [Roseiflexaceae bacterium]